MSTPDKQNRKRGNDSEEDGVSVDYSNVIFKDSSDESDAGYTAVRVPARAVGGDGGAGAPGLPTPPSSTRDPEKKRSRKRAPARAVGGDGGAGAPDLPNPTPPAGVPARPAVAVRTRPVRRATRVKPLAPVGPVDPRDNPFLDVRPSIAQVNDSGLVADMMGLIDSVQRLSAVGAASLSRTTRSEILYVRKNTGVHQWLMDMDISGQ